MYQSLTFYDFFYEIQKHNYGFIRKIITTIGASAAKGFLQCEIYKVFYAYPFCFYDFSYV